MAFRSHVGSQIRGVWVRLGFVPGGSRTLSLGTWHSLLAPAAYSATQVQHASLLHATRPHSHFDIHPALSASAHAGLRTSHSCLWACLGVARGASVTCKLVHLGTVGERTFLSLSLATWKPATLRGTDLFLSCLSYGLHGIYSSIFAALGWVVQPSFTRKRREVTEGRRFTGADYNYQPQVPTWDKLPLQPCYLVLSDFHTWFVSSVCSGRPVIRSSPR
ncbi:hypothetical protein BU26DRAFT_120351 [Trematosphaeria pertusa]|uniref:Uncharacterized protein n=1 Tax=Trematosphaeria pertusa TaxID=390896 RepID=A0A6A6HXV7_9PLEO|nr:uncharacterized protein BU26DRAFT_120351 [Trematosphaeria pertusa]KAF2242871.1 hypothetical protein BU26DRAFT_120351 [Trematosphaeria pertusa]